MKQSRWWRGAMALMLALVCCFSCFVACDEGENSDKYTRVDAAGEADSDGEYILFGFYPQSRVKDEDLQANLRLLAGVLPTAEQNAGWTSYEYYLGGEVADYMWYRDMEHEGNMYRAVYFTAYRAYMTGTLETVDTSTGQYRNGYEKGEIYWFRYDPIKWKIAEVDETGTATLVAEMLLDGREYDDHISDSNNYAQSNIRAWLNDSFYKTAFDEVQREIVLKTKVDNGLESTGYHYNDHVCEDTEDHVYLMSYKEAKAYFTTDEARIKAPTAYAECQGAHQMGDTRSAGFIWLRSPSYDRTDYARYVTYEGVCAYDYEVGVSGVGICPVIKIKL